MEIAGYFTYSCKNPPNGIAKKRSINPSSFRKVSQQLVYIFKTKSAPATTMTNKSLPGQKEVHSIFQHWKPLISKPSNQFYVARKDSSIVYKFPTSFFFNFPLVSVAQYKANSIAIYQYNAKSSTDFFVSQIRRHIALNQSELARCLDDPIKPRRSF